MTKEKKAKKIRISELKEIYFKHYANYLNSKQFTCVQEIIKDEYDPKEHGYITIQKINDEYYIKRGLDILVALIRLRRYGEIDIKELLEIRQSNKNYREVQTRKRKWKKKKK